MATRSTAPVDAGTGHAPRFTPMPFTRDAIVLGAGPAGLGATLALARAGARVTLVDAAGRVGGLCTTRWRGDIGYDIGGHIPFVRDAARLEWMRDLLGDGLHWVPRPVRSVRDGRIRAGRYLDQPGAPATVPHDGSAFAELARLAGPEAVEREMRAYLQKIDGVALERIPADRACKLRDGQAAPEGFHFPVRGIGALMDAMAEAACERDATILTGTRVRAIDAPDGRVRGVVAEDADGPRALRAPRVVVAMPAGPAARLLTPAPAGESLATVRMRAVCIVYLAVTPAQPFDDAWVQVDDPAVPFARAFAPHAWSAALVPPGVTVFGCECYCTADAADPLWSLDDGALADACRRALVERLGWIDAAASVTTLEVLRLPGAYPLPDRAQIEAVRAPALLLAQVEGVQHAPGAAVIEAIENGEAAAARALAGAAGVGA